MPRSNHLLLQAPPAVASRFVAPTGINSSWSLGVVRSTSAHKSLGSCR
jgi:hypothetical protein